MPTTDRPEAANDGPDLRSARVAEQKAPAAPFIDCITLLEQMEVQPRGPTAVDAEGRQVVVIDAYPKVDLSWPADVVPDNTLKRIGAKLLRHLRKLVS